VAEHGETPRFSGRAVVALASDPDVMRWTASAITTRRAALEYGFTDVDGHQPPQEMRIGRHLGPDAVPALLTMLEPFPPSHTRSFE
jgi:hypothetical protein